MNRRYVIYLGLIAVLAVILLGRWWPNAAKQQAGLMTGSQIYLPEDFHLRMESNNTSTAVHRDLFQPVGKAAVQTSARNTIKPVAFKAVVQAPVKIEPTAAEIAAIEMGKIKLLGVVFRASKGQAFLSRDKQNFMAYSGDTVLGHYVVEKISVDAVDLKDLKTNISRKISVSGK